MPTRKKLTVIGNGLGVEIDKHILELLGIDRETELELRTDGRRLMVEPIKSRRKRVAEATRRMMDTHDGTFRKLSK